MPTDGDNPAEDQEAMCKEEARWREFMQERDEVEMSTITWAVPVKSRHADEIVATAAQVYARIRSLQIPVVRVHLDRAGGLEVVHFGGGCRIVACTSRTRQEMSRVGIPEQNVRWAT